MKLLGRLGPRCSNLVPQNEDEMAAKLAIGWQISGHLELSLPLGDMKPKVQLDAFLPRILHLVHHTSKDFEPKSYLISQYLVFYFYFRKAI